MTQAISIFSPLLKTASPAVAPVQSLPGGAAVPSAFGDQIDNATASARPMPSAQPFATLLADTDGTSPQSPPVVSSKTDPWPISPRPLPTAAVPDATLSSGSDQPDCDEATDGRSTLPQQDGLVQLPVAAVPEQSPKLQVVAAIALDTTIPAGPLDVRSPRPGDPAVNLPPAARKPSLPETKTERSIHAVSMRAASTGEPLRPADRVPAGSDRGIDATASAGSQQPAIPAMPLEFSVSAAWVRTVDTASATQPAERLPVIDMAGTEWIATLSREIVATSADRRELSFRIAPEYLGMLEIGLADTSQGLVIELRTTTEEASRTIARHESMLLDELRQKGVAIAEYSLRNGASDDGRRHHNGATAQPFRPSNDADRNTVRDQDQDRTLALRGRFA